MPARTTSSAGLDLETRLEPVGRVVSDLHELAGAPRQADEGAPPAWLVFDVDAAPALEGIRVGADIVVLTWLHLADRDVLRVHPRGDRSRPQLGVFATRSADRPNPIGLHQVRIEARDDLRLRVRGLEAVSGTPILDVKPILSRRIRAR